MKLNLTKSEVMVTVMPVEIETCTFDKDGKPLKLFVRHYVEDWLTLYNEVKVQTKLIERLEKALKHAVNVIDHSFTWNDETIENALDKVEAWRAGREQK